MNIMKKHLILLFAIINFQVYSIANNHTCLFGNTKETICNLNLKECTVTPELFGLVKEFIHNNELQAQSIIYLLFEKSDYPYTESLQIFSYADDPLYYNVCLIYDELITHVGYFQCEDFYCVIEQNHADNFMKNMYKFTGKIKVFDAYKPALFDGPDDTPYWEFYEYINQKFTQRKYLR